jgi:hypothetical protein
MGSVILKIIRERLNAGCSGKWWPRYDNLPQWKHNFLVFMVQLFSFSNSKIIQAMRINYANNFFERFLFLDKRKSERARERLIFRARKLYISIYICIYIYLACFTKSHVLTSHDRFTFVGHAIFPSYSDARNTQFSLPKLVFYNY